MDFDEKEARSTREAESYCMARFKMPVCSALSSISTKMRRHSPPVENAKILDTFLCVVWFPADSVPAVFQQSRSLLIKSV